MNQGHKIGSLFVNRVAKLLIFVLNTVRVRWPWRLTSTQVCDWLRKQ